MCLHWTKIRHLSRLRCVKRTGANRPPATKFAARQNKPAAFYPYVCSFIFQFHFAFFFECGFCPNLLGFSTCLLSFFSIAAVAACHVQCILEFDDFFFSLLHRHPFLQIQYIWTASVTQSIISLHFFVYFCFSLLFFCLNIFVASPRGFCPFDRNVNWIFYMVHIPKVENNYVSNVFGWYWVSAGVLQMSTLNFC